MENVSGSFCREYWRFEDMLDTGPKRDAVLNAVISTEIRSVFKSTNFPEETSTEIFYSVCIIWLKKIAMLIKLITIALIVVRTIQIAF